MTIYENLDVFNQRFGKETLDFVPSAGIEKFGSTFNRTIADSSLSQAYVWANNQSDLIDSRNKILEIEGEAFFDEVKALVPKMKFGEDSDDYDKREQSVIDSFIALRRMNDPEKWKDVQTFEEINHKNTEYVRAVYAESDDINRRYTGSALAGFGIDLAAGAVGSVLFDPVNASTMMLGMPSNMKLLPKVLGETAINMGVEAAQTPSRLAFQEQAGVTPDTTEQALLNIGFAGVGAGVLTGVRHGLGKLATRKKRDDGEFTRTPADISEQIDEPFANDAELSTVTVYRVTTADVAPENPMTDNVPSTTSSTRPPYSSFRVMLEEMDVDSFMKLPYYERLNILDKAKKEEKFFEQQYLLRKQEKEEAEALYLEQYNFEKGLDPSQDALLQIGDRPKSFREFLSRKRLYDGYGKEIGNLEDDLKALEQEQVAYQKKYNMAKKANENFRNKASVAGVLKDIENHDKAIETKNTKDKIEEIIATSDDRELVDEAEMALRSLQLNQKPDSFVGADGDAAHIKNLEEAQRAYKAGEAPRYERTDVTDKDDEAPRYERTDVTDKDDETPFDETKNYTFSGALTLNHGSQKELPKNVFVNNFSGDRYDDNVFGNNVVYLDETGRWVENTYYAGFTVKHVYEVEGSFKKAFVLTPQSIFSLSKMLRSEISNTKKYYSGNDIVSFLKTNGYDGLLIRGFDSDVNTAKLQDSISEKTKISSDVFQDQAISFNPSSQLKVKSKKWSWQGEGNKTSYKMQTTKKDDPAAADMADSAAADMALTEAESIDMLFSPIQHATERLNPLPDIKVGDAEASLAYRLKHNPESVIMNDEGEMVSLADFMEQLNEERYIEEALTTCGIV